MVPTDNIHGAGNHVIKYDVINLSLKHPQICIFREFPGDSKLGSEDIPDAIRDLIARYGFVRREILAKGWLKMVCNTSSKLPNLLLGV
jgi:predicted DNA-binding transcriptional regulator